MDEQEYKDFLLEIANKVDKLILNPTNMDQFRNQMRIFGEMREAWNQTKTQHKKIAEADPRLRAGPPPDPIDWVWPLGSSTLTRPPNDKEKLMCDYFLLTVIHDGALTDSMDKCIYFKRTDNGMWLNLDGGSIAAIPSTARLFWEEDLSRYKRGLEYAKNNKTKAKIERALDHVMTDLAKLKPAATEQNAAPAKPERESWWWKLYEKTVKAFFDSLLGKS